MIINTFTRLWKHSQMMRFLFVGGTTVLIDFIVYSTLLLFGNTTQISKGVGFFVGTVFAYFANKKVTFRSRNSGLLKFLLFILLYLFSLSANVVTNEIVLYILNYTKLSFLLAFLIATALSASMNFFGMKYIIFNKQNEK